MALIFKMVKLVLGLMFGLLCAVCVMGSVMNLLTFSFIECIMNIILAVVFWKVATYLF